MISRPGEGVQVDAISGIDVDAAARPVKGQIQPLHAGGLDHAHVVDGVGLHKHTWHGALCMKPSTMHASPASDCIHGRQMLELLASRFMTICLQVMADGKLQLPRPGQLAGYQDGKQTSTQHALASGSACSYI